MFSVLELSQFYVIEMSKSVEQKGYLDSNKQGNWAYNII